MGMWTYTKKYSITNSKLVVKVVLFKLFKHPKAKTEEVEYIKFVWDEHIRIYKKAFKHPSCMMDECRNACVNIDNAYKKLIKNL